MQRQNYISQIVHRDMAVDENYARVSKPDKFEMEDDRRMIAVPPPEPTEERELTPSPGLRELSTPDPSNEPRLTPSPEMTSPDMYLPLPEPPEDIDFLGIDLSLPEPAMFIPLTINTNSSEIQGDETKIIQYNEPKTAETRESLEDNLPKAPNFKLNKGTSERSRKKCKKSKEKKLISNICKKEKQHTIAKKKLAITSKPMEIEISNEDTESDKAQQQGCSALQTLSPINMSQSPTQNQKSLDIELTESETAQYLPESVELSNYNENNNLKLLAYTCDKNMQMCMTNKNIASSMAKEADSFNLERESCALGFHRAMESVSPEFGVGTTNHTKHRNYKKINSFKSKQKTQSTRLKNKYVKAESSDLKDGSAAKDQDTCSTESSENCDSGGQEMSEPQIDDLEVTEISEGTPEPIQPPEEKRPTRLRLLPIKTKQKTSKTLMREKVATSELDESELDIIVSEMNNYENKPVTFKPLKTTESSENSDKGDQEMSESQIDDLELSEISEGTPEPINPPRRKRSPRIQLLPSEEQRRARIRLLPTKKSLDEMKLLPSLISPINKWSGRRDSISSSFPSISARAQALSSAQAQPSSSGSRAVIRVTVPRTRILVTPERFKSRVHTPDRKPKKGTSKKYLRYAAKKRKWVKSVRRHPERSRSNLNPTETNEDSTDSGNTGDCSGLGEDDDNEDDHNIDSGVDKEGSRGGKIDMSGNRGVGESGIDNSGMAERGKGENTKKLRQVCQM